MRDWGWQDRAEWTAQDTGRGSASERTRRSEVNAVRPVWGEWEGVVEEHFGAVIWEWYGERMRRLEERKQEKEWGDKVADLLPLIIKLTDEIGRTPAIDGALQRLMGRKPKSKVSLTSAELVSAWRNMTVEEIIDGVRAEVEEAHRASFDVVAETPTQNIRVASSGDVPQNNPFAALKGLF